MIVFSETNGEIMISRNGSPPIPPSDVIPESVRIDDIEGINIQRSNFVIQATFSIPESAYPGKKDVAIQFAAPPDIQNAEPMVFTKRVH